MSEADRYRLAPVRDARARDERTRKGDLAAAVGDAHDTETRVTVAEQRVAVLRDDVEAARRTLHAQLADGTTTDAISVAERFLVRKRRDLEAAIDAQFRAQAVHRGQLGEVEAARGRLALARAHKEVIERHFARWRTERDKLAERRED